MIEGTDIAAGLNVIVYMVPVAALIVSIFTFTKSSDERHKKSAAEQAGISAKLDANAMVLDKIERQQDELVNGYHENHESIARIEGEIKDLRRRIATLEDDFKRLSEQVQ